MGSVNGVECSILSQTRVYEVMSTPPVTVDVDASIELAAKRMYEAGVGSVVVLTNDGRLAGIFTRRDLIYLVASGIARKNPPIRLYMSESVITAVENETLEQALEKMSETRVRHLVVLDGSGNVVGVISLWDILTLLTRKCISKYI
jgi:CBS domain-containing protein